MRDIVLLAQVAANFTQLPVVYVPSGGGPERAAQPSLGLRKGRGLRDCLRVGTEVLEDQLQLVFEVKSEMMRRALAYDESWTNAQFTVAVWRSRNPASRHTTSGKRIDLVLLEALAGVLGDF